MKYLFLLYSILLFGCNAKSKGPLRYDGIYATPTAQNEHGDSYRRHLKFYDNGTVISVSSSGTPEQISKWFTKGHENVDEGNYKVEGNNISFTVSDRGKAGVEYNGTITDKEHLTLHSKSVENNHEAESTFIFEEIK